MPTNIVYAGIIHTHTERDTEREQRAEEPFDLFLFLYLSLSPALLSVSKRTTTKNEERKIEKIENKNGPKGVWMG
jgi:hypothetical protein